MKTENAKPSTPVHAPCEPPQIEIDKLKSLVIRCYKAIHRGHWQDGETESELADAINDQMSDLYGNDWSR